MKQNYKIYLAALLLAGAASMMTARAQGSGNKPTLAVFVVGMSNNDLGNQLATQLGANLTSGGRYTLTSVNTTVKRDELRAAYTSGGGSSIDRNALAEWGRANGVSTICLVVDDVKGNDNLFSAQLIDAKEGKLEGKGSYVRTGVTSNDLSRVSLALAKQLEGQGRKRSATVPARSYPAELDIEMVRVTGGTFQIGCNGGTDAPCNTNGSDTPTRRVTVSDFSIGKYEVTRAQWRAALSGNATLLNIGNWKDDDQLPIESVLWSDVEEFLTRLNALTGKNYRLPTNAEWEYAARGCKAGQCDAYTYSGSNNPAEVGWYLGNSNGRTHPVGQKKPNGLGIYDMSGNVWEYCSDYYDANYYKNTLKDGDINPKGPATGTVRVRRGSGCASDVVWSRVAARHNADPDYYTTYGFRLALD